MAEINVPTMKANIASAAENAPSDAFWGSTGIRRVANFTDYVYRQVAPSLINEPIISGVTANGIDVMGSIITRSSQAFRSDEAEDFLSTLGSEGTADHLTGLLAFGANGEAERIEEMYGLGTEWLGLDMPMRQVVHHEVGEGGFFALQEDDRTKLQQLAETANGCPFRRALGQTMLTLAAALDEQGIIDQLLRERTYAEVS